tara:strand:+ start:265 stop:1140 length:876 start_codon:yes stop_codon:yes gene_type:complete
MNLPEVNHTNIVEYDPDAILYGKRDFDSYYMMYTWQYLEESFNYKNYIENDHRYEFYGFYEDETFKTIESEIFFFEKLKDTIKLFTEKNDAETNRLRVIDIDTMASISFREIVRINNQNAPELERRRKFRALLSRLIIDVKKNLFWLRGKKNQFPNLDVLGSHKDSFEFKKEYSVDPLIKLFRSISKDYISPIPEEVFVEILIGKWKNGEKINFELDTKTKFAFLIDLMVKELKPYFYNLSFKSFCESGVFRLNNEPLNHSSLRRCMSASRKNNSSEEYLSELKKHFLNDF